MTLTVANNVNTIVSLEVIQPQINSSILSKTAMGWVVLGPTIKQGASLYESL